MCINRIDRGSGWDVEPIEDAQSFHNHGQIDDWSFDNTDKGEKSYDHGQSHHHDLYINNYHNYPLLKL